MKLETRSNTIAAIGTVIFMVLVFLLLWFVLINVPQPEEDEGIMVSFGDSELGGGREDGGFVAEAATPQTTAPAPQPAANEEFLAQEDEQSLALQRKKEEERRRQKEAEEAERIAREKRLAEQRAKEQAAIDKANAMGALFGQTDSDEGANGLPGESASSATKGNPLGHGSSGGNSWSLNGRRLQGSLPRPSATFKQEGVVVVNITVDASGNVISATVGAGTTVSDYATKQLAIDAAKKAKFDVVDRPDKMVGKITYNFRFK